MTRHDLSTGPLTLTLDGRHVATIVTPAEAAALARKQPSRIDAYAHLLGTVPDGEIAERAGVSRQAVTQYRKACGVKACRGRA